MLDYQLFVLLRQVIAAGLTANGFVTPEGGELVEVVLPANIQTLQSYQPTQEGIPTGPAIYLNKVPGDHRYGAVLRKSVWNEETEIMDYTEIEQIESTFQISTLASQDPKKLVQLTASDIANITAGILQSSATIETLMAAGVGVLKISDIRNPQFIDDKNRFEANPNFDCTLIHKQTIIKTTPTVTDFEYNFKRV